jgi:hypothetical protein
VLLQAKPRLGQAKPDDVKIGRPARANEVTDSGVDPGLRGLSELPSHDERHEDEPGRQGDPDAGGPETEESSRDTEEPEAYGESQGER